jgi:hypothetical protein
MMLKLDHFTPLSRAVASIDRDAYAARFAVYDREHKKLLRRLATAESPLSDADIAREEQAFRDAIRRIEFADDGEQAAPEQATLDEATLDEATLVPQDEPVETPPPEPSPERRSEPVWPQLRASRGETLEAPDFSHDELEPESAVAPVLRVAPRRSVSRRVGERLALAVVALVLTGVLWMPEARRDRAPAAPTARSSEPAASDPAADAKAQQPAWLSPEMFYAPPTMPSAAPSSSAPRADVPLPVPRPDR